MSEHEQSEPLRNSDVVAEISKLFNIAFADAAVPHWFSVTATPKMIRPPSPQEPTGGISIVMLVMVCRRTPLLDGTLIVSHKAVEDWHLLLDPEVVKGFVDGTKVSLMNAYNAMLKQN